MFRFTGFTGTGFPGRSGYLNNGTKAQRYNGTGHRAQGTGRRAQGAEHRVQGTGCRAQGSGQDVINT